MAGDGLVFIMESSNEILSQTSHEGTYLHLTRNTDPTWLMVLCGEDSYTLVEVYDGQCQPRKPMLSCRGATICPAPLL